MKGIVWQWRSRWAAFTHDLLSIPIAWFGAYWLRFNLSQIPQDILSQAVWVLPWVICLQSVAFWALGLYRGVWRFASLPDLVRIIKSIALGGLLTLLVAFLFTRLEHIPRSVVPLYSLLLLFILGGSRFCYRLIKDKRSRRGGTKVLVVGAGRAGESLVRDLLRYHAHTIPKAFVDDNPTNQGREIHGIRVVGRCEDIPTIVKQLDIDMILIAMPSANSAVMRRITAICDKTKLPMRTLPSTSDLMRGVVSLKNLREISLEDLLGRDPIRLDWQSIKALISHQVVLVSGGGGSIGSELCRQLLQLSPKKLVVVDNSEYNLFMLEQDFSTHPLEDHVDVQFVLADVSDYAAMDRLIKGHQIHIIFHAAAYKHVPLLEPQIRAALKNNVLGTYQLAQAAVNNQVDNFVLVSTDKAVNPTNVMGATKRMAELVCQYFNAQSPTQFITVRFGNVLGSRGSVVETFTRQLEAKEALTVTHPEVKRYFMTIPEASQLIMQALAIGQGGELFVLDMGEPVRIRYLAEQMIRLAGKKTDEVKIEYIGLRPGEKLYEELFHDREELSSTQHEKILKAKARAVETATFEAYLAYLLENIEILEESQLLSLLTSWVPEFNNRPKVSAENVLEGAIS